MESLPGHGSCFVCGNTDPHSIGIIWQKNPNGRIESTFAFNFHQQGPPGLVHGGASAAVMDETMGTASLAGRVPGSYCSSRIGLSKTEPDWGRNLSSRQFFFVEGIHSITTQGEIYLPDGTVAVEVRGLHALAPQLYQDIPKSSKYTIRICDHGKWLFSTK